MVGHHPRPELQLLAAKHQLQHEHPAQLLRVPGTGHRESGRPDVAPSLLLQRVFVEPRFQSEVGLDQKPSLLVQLRHPCGNRRTERSGQQGPLCGPVPSVERFRMAQHQGIRHSARLPTGLHGLVQSTARKIPCFSWMSLDGNYTANYSWERGMELEDGTSYGNTINNQRSATINGRFNLETLYNFSSFLKEVNKKFSASERKKAKDKSNREREKAKAQKKKRRKPPPTGRTGKTRTGRTKRTAKRRTTPKVRPTPR